MDRIRERLEQTFEARARALWRLWTGRTDRLELDRLADELGDVLEGDLLEEARRELDLARLDSERDARRRLLFALEHARVFGATREVASEEAHANARARAFVSGREEALFSARLRIAYEADADGRARIGDAIDAAEEPLDEIRVERYVQSGAAIEALGHGTRAGFERTLLEALDLEGWSAHAERLIEATEAEWRRLAYPQLKELGIDPAHARRSDEARVGAEPHAARLLPRAPLGELAGFVTQGLGLRDGAPGVELDLEPRPGKQPRSRTLPLRVPGSVGVSIAPIAGLQTAADLLHRLGEALPRAYTSPALPVERRWVGDPALGEAFGWLTSAPLCDAEWLADLVSGPAVEEVAAAARRRRLARVRRVSALARVEGALAMAPAAETPTGYAERFEEELTRATGLVYRRAGWLAEFGVRPRSLHALRGACLAARLEEWLRLEYGRRFWRERGSSELLKELWNTGTTYTADALASELGLGAIEPEPLIEAFEAR